MSTSSASGDDAGSARPCRGWGLVASPSGLTPAEREAGARHVALCRRCRDRRSALERTRARLTRGAAATVGAAAATQGLPLGGTTTGVGILVGSKAGAAVVGGVASAVLATAGTVAVAQPEPFHRAPEPAVTRSVPTPTPSPSVRIAVPPSAAPVPTAGHSGVPLPTRQPRTAGPVATPVPTALPSVGPTFGTTTSIPLPLPTLPLPLPTSLELPDLLP